LFFVGVFLREARGGRKGRDKASVLGVRRGGTKREREKKKGKTSRVGPPSVALFVDEIIAFQKPLHRFFSPLFRHSSSSRDLSGTPGG
jgi:hypothetical protein